MAVTQKKALTEKQGLIYNFLKETDGEKFTAYQIADTTGIERRSINVLINGICAKGYCVREEVTTQDAEGKSVIVKYIVLTDEGRAYDHASALAHDEELAAARKAAEAEKRAAKKAAADAE